MSEAQREFLSYRNQGVSIIEVGHRTPIFREVLEETKSLFRELTKLPDSHKILFVHGGARLQFSAVPLNLMARSSSRKASYIETGNFAKQAAEEARRYGNVEVVASSRTTAFDRIPDCSELLCDPTSAYLHITSNNTVYGTRWNEIPRPDGIPVVGDITSDILSRQLDYSKLDLAYAGFQKNLGPSALALVLAHDDLLGHALPQTPLLLNYALYAEEDSLYNTTNTFAIYMMRLILRWIQKSGGVAAMERINEEKAGLIYDYLDESDFYSTSVIPKYRSRTNVTFQIVDSNLTAEFLRLSHADGLILLAGHRSVGGIRASIYNGMPIEGVKALVELMKEFERTHG